ncbi:toll/interleukin-1 receptor domain-containing protein [Candidatus Uabimicrobium sp. HlEnr_7]|uniref:toll/interleukin-1 receptor domain-containing protein n=1 Tax=Candidatus Uabimicrobium helgolandensis TaxID=3095367 RepID=UPI0035575535
MGILVFISYATPDSETFQISEIAKSLKNRDQIADVLYWEEHMHDDIMKYMNDNLAKCHVVLVFCTNNSFDSESVQLEWMTGIKLKKKVIPIFMSPDDIPPLLTTKLGIEFSKDKFAATVDKMYSLILKKHEGVEINITDSQGHVTIDKFSLDMDIEDLTTKVADAMFNDHKEVIVGKYQYWVKKYKSNGVHFVDIKPYRFLEQNPNKPSQYGKMAKAGHKVIWVTKNGNYFARWVDGQFYYIGN